MISNNNLKNALLITNCCRNIALALALFLSLITPITTLAEQSSPEYAIKAAYIFNILRFVESANSSWLDDVDEIKICLLGTNKLDQYIKPIETKKINGKPLQISQLTSLHQTLGCQLIFTSNTETYPPDEITKLLGDKKIIVVGDDMGFTQNGGMFSFYIEDNKVRLGLNIKALERSGLKVSSLLLEVCAIFGEDE